MLLGLQESSPRMNARRQGSWACRAIDARVPRVLGLGGQVALRGADQALRPALPCRRGPGSGHAAKQPLHTGPPDLRLLTQRTDDRPVSREEASAREGVLPARTSPPHWGVLWGPRPLCGRLWPLEENNMAPPFLSGWPSGSLQLTLPLQGLLGPLRKGPAAHLSLTSHPPASLQGGLTVTCPPGCGEGRRLGPQLGGPGSPGHDSADRPHRASPSPL